MRDRVRFQWARVLFALLLREMSSRFGRAWGGYLWAIAEPVGGIALLSVAFSLAFHEPPLGTNFPLFYATGFIPFLMYATTAANTSAAMTANRGLLAYPAVSVLDTVLARWLLDTGTYAVIAAILFPGIVLAFGLDVSIRYEMIVLSLAMASLTGLGVGTLNTVLFGFFPAWKQVWSIINRPLFLVSGVLFTFESLPRDWAGYFWVNPVFHAVGAMRRGFFGAYRGDYVSVGYVLALAASLFIVGAALLRRNEARILDRK